jgi:tRNA U34 5-methylaminomethyl-2-thiouridine-forming methyltransferase MnmC
MPYVTRDAREQIDHRIEALAEALPEIDNLGYGGMLNYTICRLLILAKPERYAHYERFLGAIHMASLEIYRRRVAALEDRKAGENGEVFT